MIVRNVLIVRRIFANCRRFSGSAIDAENPYYAKYREKLDKLAAAAGRSNEVPAVRKETVVAADRDQGTRSIKLHDILQVEKIGELPPERIAEIWLEYYRRARDAGRNELGAVLSGPDYETIGHNAKLFPRFVFAVPFPDHFQFFYSEFANNSFHFTPLLEFQRWRENAPVCLLVRLFDELLATKKLAFVRAEFDANVLSADRVACLVAETTAYYTSQPGTERNHLLSTFNRRPDEFRHERVIEYVRGASESSG